MFNANTVCSRINISARRAGIVSLAGIAAVAIAGPIGSTGAFAKAPAPAPVVVSSPTTVSASSSDLSAYTTGDGAIYVTVTLRDSSMTAVAGKVVQMVITSQKTGAVDRYVTVTNTGGNLVTDANGQVSFKLTSTKQVNDYGKAVDSTDGLTLPQNLYVGLPTARY